MHEQGVSKILGSVCVCVHVYAHVGGCQWEIKSVTDRTVLRLEEYLDGYTDHVIRHVGKQPK